MISGPPMITLIERFRNICLQRYSEDIDTLSNSDRAKRLGFDSRDDIEGLLGGHRKRRVEDICRLANTPRLLKLVFRKTYRTWEHLHGEIDFDDMLVADVLRFTAPEAFDFLLQNRREILGLNTDETSRIERLKAVEGKWDKVIGNVKWDSTSAKELVQFIFICWPFGKHQHNVLQSLQVTDPTDYWSRYLTEELETDEIRDQEILKSIREWKKRPNGLHFRNASLPLILSINSEFSAKFEYFAALILDGPDFRSLATRVFDEAIKQHGIKASSDSVPGFIPLWRQALNKPIDKTKHLEWVQEEIFKVLPISFRLSNDIFYYWSSNSHQDVHMKVPCTALRRNIVSEAKKLFSDSPDRFLKTLDPDYMYSSSHFSLLLPKNDKSLP